MDGFSELRRKSEKEGLQKDTETLILGDFGLNMLGVVHLI